MKIELNGIFSEFQEGITLAGLLDSLKIKPQGVAIEVNLNIIKKCDYPAYELKDGDTVEIINFVGGG